MTEIDIIFRTETDGDLGDRLYIDIASRSGDARPYRCPPLWVSNLELCWNTILDALLDYAQRATVKRLTCRIIEGNGSEQAQQVLRTLVKVAAHEAGVAVMGEKGEDDYATI